MKSKRAITLFALAITVLAAPFVSAEAQPLSDAQIEVIRQNCTEAQQTMKRLQSNEAAARVNRGREYETTIRLLATFNSRVVLNKHTAPVLTSTTSEIEKRFAAFRTNYIAYDDQLKNVLRLRCNEQPVTFYDQLTLAREARAKVAEDVRSINALLDQYQGALTNLRTNLSGGGAGQ